MELNVLLCKINPVVLFDTHVVLVKILCNIHAVKVLKLNESVEKEIYVSICDS